MTTISAKVIKDSVSPVGHRLTTLQLRYPRWIHAEGRTHRVLGLGEDEFDGWEPRTPSLMEDKNLSRNASSSRAIPVARLIQDVLDDPAIPLFWGANQRGMQAGTELNAPIMIHEFIRPAGHTVEHLTQLSREDAWLRGRDQMIELARAFDAAGYHKQIVNRLLEPFSHINVVVTATEWSNFFALRRHRDAEPHIHLLADRMHEAMAASTPRRLDPGEWHLPYCEGVDEDLIPLSVARCARVSYLTHEGKEPNAADDIVLYDRLVGSTPLHASPAEHQGTPDELTRFGWQNPARHGNLVGWVQHRKTLPGESQ